MADDLLTRDEVLGGLPARRASALLYLIESRTAQLVDRARHALAPFRSEDVVRERELAFVEAFAVGREPPLRPAIQDLERQAGRWAELVPANPRLRAAVAHQMGQKYQFGQEDVPALRAALGLDDPAVQRAYERLYGEPLDRIYAARPSPLGRLRWARASLGRRLESLPPFWTGFALTLTETVGAGVLALPIALATVGPLAGVVLLAMLGIVNLITIAWMAEAATRTASIRYGRAYFGRFVTEYLGRAGGTLLTIALVTICAALFIAYAIGLATTLASATGIAAALWVAVLFAVVVSVISRDSLSSTIVSALGLGAVNLVVILTLTVLGFAHLSTENIRRVEVPGIGGTPFDVSFISLIFGVVLISYFGHTSVGNCAAIVLQRDPSGRSLIWGAATAQIVAIVVYATWVLAINGSIAPDALEGYAGTALDPLADIAGPSVYVLGSIFVVLAMGMGAIHQGLGLVNTVRERLPRKVDPVVLLPRRSGRLVFTSRRDASDGGPRLVLTYRGLDGGEPSFQLNAQVAGRTLRATRTGASPWTAREALGELPRDAADAFAVRVEPIDADGERARLRITSGMRTRAEGMWPHVGIDLAGVLDDDAATPDDPDAALLRWILRQGEVTVGDAAAWAGEDAGAMEARLHALAERGAVRPVERGDGARYRAAVARRRGRSLPQGMPGGAVPDGGAIRNGMRRATGGIFDDRWRSLLEYSPLVLLFLVTEWLVIGERASYTVLLSFAGVVAVPIFAGIFPPLLLQSSRRRGDLVPAVVYRFLGRPWLSVAVYALFLIGILLHGALIWQQAGERAAALVAGALVLVVTWVSIRRGALRTRTVAILRDDQRPGGATSFEVVSSGQRAAVETRVRRGDTVEHIRAATIDMPDLAALREITAQLPADRARDLKVWANRITPEGDTESLPAHARLTCGDDDQEVDLRFAGGQALLPRAGAECGLAISIDQPSTPAKPARRGRVDLDSLLSAASDADPVRVKGD